MFKYLILAAMICLQAQARPIQELSTDDEIFDFLDENANFVIVYESKRCNSKKLSQSLLLNLVLFIFCFIASECSVCSTVDKDMEKVIDRHSGVVFARALVEPSSFFYKNFIYYPERPTFCIYINSKQEQCYHSDSASSLNYFLSKYGFWSFDEADNLFVIGIPLKFVQ